MSKHDEMKRVAEAAPSGPWVAENDSLYFKDDGYTRHLMDADAGHDVKDDAYYAALSFIAAANPAAVLALIAEIDGLYAQHGRDSGELRKLCAARDSARRERDQLNAELATERKRRWDGNEISAREHAEEVRKLKAENEVLRSALAALLDLYDTDEGCRNLPQYIAGRAAMSKGEQS